MAGELREAFPKVEARIVAVTGDTVRLEGPTAAALRPGLELLAYRQGAFFRHPITNQPLGRAEEENVGGVGHVSRSPPPSPVTRGSASSPATRL